MSIYSPTKEFAEEMFLQIEAQPIDKFREELIGQSGIMSSGANPMDDPEVRKQVSRSLKEYYKENGHPSTGRTVSESQRKKQSESMSGRAPWNKGTKGLCPGNVGLVLSQETKDRISEAVSEAMTGRKHSEETKKKMREAAKKRWNK